MWEDTVKSHFIVTAKYELIKEAIKNTTDFVPYMREYSNVDGKFRATGKEWTIDVSAFKFPTDRILKEPYLGIDAIREK